MSNLAQTLHSLAKFKNKQVTKIWSLKKQKIGAAILFPEGLKNIPFKITVCISFYILDEEQSHYRTYWLSTDICFGQTNKVKKKKKLS